MRRSRWTRSLLLSAIDDWLAPAPDPAKVAWLGKWDYAHRGLHGPETHGPGTHGLGTQGPGRVENSASAFQAAINAGLGIECDIQRSRDNLPMVIHDWDLRRLIGQGFQTGELSAAEMRILKYQNSDEGPISLDALLELANGQVPILIEVKSKPHYDVDRTCHLIRDQLDGYGGKFAVMSFDPRVSRWLARHAPQIVRGLVMKHEHFPQWYGYPIRRASLWYARPDFLAHDIRDLPAGLPAAQRARGMPVVSWTIRTPQLRARAARYADAPIAEGNGLA